MYSCSFIRENSFRYTRRFVIPSEVENCYFFFSFFFNNLSIFYLHFECYSLSRFPIQHPPTPPSPLRYGCSPLHPPPITTLPPTITFTGDTVLAGPRAFPSTGALTRIFIATYEVRVQGQSMHSLWVVA